MDILKFGSRLLNEQISKLTAIGNNFNIRTINPEVRSEIRDIIKVGLELENLRLQLENQGIKSRIIFNPMEQRNGQPAKGMERNHTNF